VYVASLLVKNESNVTNSDANVFWWHSIDLGNGVVTPGQKSLERLENELERMALPSLKGKTVLDIGAWDGFFSFTAEKLHAARVVALDSYVWALDLFGVQKYNSECKAKGVLPVPGKFTPFWRPEQKPGKRGFDIAHKALNSNVESVFGDFMEVDPEQIGTFDVVLFLGVLYHVQNPLGALRRVAALTKELAVIETHAILLPALEHRALCEFYPTNELSEDVTNWWGPNLKALEALCLAAGFKRVDVVHVPERHRTFWYRLYHRLQYIFPGSKSRRPRYYRAVVHAWK
jgi:tRNA (mo5U34)-methyltransferase